jgi:pimeloyl-ACP methyl ester carboxylesterase
VAANTSLVFGDCDQVVPLTHGRMLLAHLPGAQLHVVVGGGHMSCVFEFARWLRECGCGLAQ